jgi:hypothetical protein
MTHFSFVTTDASIQPRGIYYPRIRMGFNAYHWGSLPCNGLGRFPLFLSPPRELSQAC